MPDIAPHTDPAPTLAAWDPAKAPAILEGFKNKSLARIKWYIDWYIGAKKTKASWSRVIRSICAVLFILTVLIPLCNQYVMDPVKKDAGILPLGYIFAALGAALLFLDRTYNFSSGWVRVNAVIFDLISLRDNFEKAYQGMLLLQPPETPDGFRALSELIRTFDAATSQLLREELANWAAEFKASNEALATYFNTQKQAAAAGNLQVTISDYKSYTSIQILLNGQDHGLVAGGTILLNALPPGNYTVLAKGHPATGHDVEKSVVGTVASGTLAVVTMTLA